MLSFLQNSFGFKLFASDARVLIIRVVGCRWFRCAQGRGRRAAWKWLPVALVYFPRFLSIPRRSITAPLSARDPSNFYKSSRARRNRENFIELISPIRRGANRSMTRKEEEGDRYRSEGERVFEKNFQTDHELTRLNNKRLINYSKRRKLLPSPPSIDRSIFRLFTPRSFSDSVEGSRIRFVSRSAR